MLEVLFERVQAAVRSCSYPFGESLPELVWREPPSTDLSRGSVEPVTCSRERGELLDITLHGAADHLVARSEEHTSELQSPMRISYAVFCLKQKINKYKQIIRSVTIRYPEECN